MDQQLIIAGFHRSGTSLVAQLMHRAGLFLGYKLLGALPSNPYGHYEDLAIIRMHDRILADHGLTWQVDVPFIPVIGKSYWDEMQQIVDQRQYEHELWGFKDPRVCLFLGPWKYLLPNAKVVMVYRHYADTTFSLARRHSRDIFMQRGPQHMHRRFWEKPDFALRMWLVHNRALLSFCHKHPHDSMVIALDVLQKGFPLVAAVKRRWDLPLGDAYVGEVYDAQVTKKTPYRQHICDESLVEPIWKTWQELERLSGETQSFMEEESDAQ